MRRLGREPVEVGVEVHDGRVAGRDDVDELRLREQHGRGRVGHHEGEPVLRVIGVERQIGAAGLEDADDAHQHVERALDAEADEPPGADAEAPQQVCKAVGPLIELTIGERLALERGGDCIRRAVRLRLEALVDGGGHREVPNRVVSVEERLPLLGGEDGELRDLLLRLAHDAEEERRQVADHALHGGVVEAALIVADAQREPAALGGDDGERIGGRLGGARAGDADTGVTAGERVVDRVVLEDEEALEERCSAGHAALGLRIDEGGVLEVAQLGLPILAGRRATRAPSPREARWPGRGWC
ncbi:MAG: hypothetical protein QM820_53430 [Minicystis sp.]